MEVWKIIVIVLAVLLFFALIIFLLAALCYKAAFGKRYDKNPLLKYFTAKDFNLTDEPFTLGQLRGRIYESPAAEKRNEIIIFVHGMGPGHCAYVTEIAYFCNLGYTVIAADSLGCGESGGKNIGGMYQGVLAAVAAVDFAKKQFGGREIYLVGHSWGGYSVLCASAKRKVDKVVAVSAPSTPVKTLYNAVAQMLSPAIATLLLPWWRLLGFLKFGKNGNLNAAKCAEKSGVPTLLIHGDKDKMVADGNAAIYSATGENTEKIICKGKAHNPYNTAKAEEQLAKLSAALMRCKKMTEEERNKFFSEFDFVAATEEDQTVMQTIAEFLKR